MISVVGAGVSGLSCALELSESGFDVEIVTRNAPLDTTSAVAAAVWWPYDPEPIEHARSWAQISLQRFLRLADEEPESGVILRRGYYRQPAGDVARWFDHLIHLGLTSSDDGMETYSLETPIIDMGIYLLWLRDQCNEAGITWTQRDIASFDDLADSSLIVNCSGLGARELASDENIRSLRGQVVFIRDSGIDEITKDETEIGVATYLYPRKNVVVLGGTVEESESLRPDDATTADIIERCAVLEPRVRGAKVDSVKVGLRPHRFAIRLEVDDQFSTPVVHNYGHGRSGVSLSWGCAQQVCKLVKNPDNR